MEFLLRAMMFAVGLSRFDFNSIGGRLLAAAEIRRAILAAGIASQLRFSFFRFYS
jgi:hypothetical protein